VRTIYESKLLEHDPERHLACLLPCLARTAFTNKDCGKGEREAQWAVEQRTLHGLNQLATSSDLPPPPSSPSRPAKVARYVSLATVFSGDELAISRAADLNGLLDACRLVELQTLEARRVGGEASRRGSASIPFRRATPRDRRRPAVAGGGVLCSSFPLVYYVGFWAAPAFCELSDQVNMYLRIVVFLILNCTAIHYTTVREC